jgi:hypothetical protein
VTVVAVHADPKHLGIGLAEIIEPRLQRGNFLASSRGPVEGVEHEHDVSLPEEVRQAKGYAEVTLQREIRGLGPNFDHGSLLFKIENFPFESLYLKMTGTHNRFQDGGISFRAANSQTVLSLTKKRLRGYNR